MAMNRDFTHVLLLRITFTVISKISFKWPAYCQISGFFCSFRCISMGAVINFFQGSLHWKLYKLTKNWLTEFGSLWYGLLSTFSTLEIAICKIWFRATFIHGIFLFLNDFSYINLISCIFSLREDRSTVKSHSVMATLQTWIFLKLRIVLFTDIYN